MSFQVFDELGSLHLIFQLGIGSSWRHAFLAYILKSPDIVPVGLLSASALERGTEMAKGCREAARQRVPQGLAGPGDSAC